METASEPDLVKLADEAFIRGDFGQARRFAATLAKSGDPAMRDQAAELRRRTGTDRIALVFTLACAALFVGIILSYL
jgi:hypothetical protein